MTAQLKLFLNENSQASEKDTISAVTLVLNELCKAIDRKKSHAAIVIGLAKGSEVFRDHSHQLF